MTANRSKWQHGFKAMTARGLARAICGTTTFECNTTKKTSEMSCPRCLSMLGIPSSFPVSTKSKQTESHVEAVLRLAREKVEASWCKDSYAYPLTEVKDASEWSVRTAIYAVWFDMRDKVVLNEQHVWHNGYIDALKRMAAVTDANRLYDIPVRHMGDIEQGLIEWNDDWQRTHKQVLGAFDRAIRQVNDE